MKKRVLFAALLFSLLFLAAARAEEAPDLTDQCKFDVSPGKFKIARIYDRDYGTTYVSGKQRNPYVALTAPKDQKLHGVYVCFGGSLYPWKAQVKRNGKWETVYESAGQFAHEYVSLPEGEREVRLQSAAEKQIEFSISEIFAFGEGELPAFVQQWQLPPEKADLLVLSAHPDDEILFFGGAIPTYAGERQMNVVVAYMTCGTKSDGTQVRRSELLNGLWEMGVRTYPVIHDFWDKYSKKLDTAYEAWGKKNTYQFVTGLLRQFKPEVVLTHDVNGEYGHGAHRVCADAVLHCVQTALDASAYADSAAQYGVWGVKKVYLHLYRENAVEMDWDQPLTAFGGRTGFEKAQDAFAWHVSQHKAGQKNAATGKFEYFVVEPRESDYSCYRFGLAYSTVGNDTAGNDFFENIPGY